MPTPVKGLYAPLLVDGIFALMGVGSAALLAFGSRNAVISLPAEGVDPMTGPLVLGVVIACALVVCLYHRIDQRGWDDYMAQVVSQSALIGMVTLILAGALSELASLQFFAAPAQLPMIMGTVPIACLGWALGYLFLRWRGTGA